LTNNAGEPINQWIGYTGGASALVNILNKALADLTIIDDRVNRFKTKPTFEDALFLAGYFSGAGENLKAVDYYRKLINLGKETGVDYSYKIFENIAYAVWNDELAFNEVLPAADAVLTAERKNDKNIIDVARLMTRLADKAGRLDILEKYLKAGIAVSSNTKDMQIQSAGVELRADYAIYIEKNIDKGIAIKKSAMPQGWQDDRDQFYMFTKWCLIRKVNLAEAEMFARKTLTQVEPGRFRARAYSTLAEILEASKKIDQAIEALKAAVEHDPENDYYKKELKRLTK
jgi:tetratricopeptide (TPR) repeat protein